MKTTNLIMEKNASVQDEVGSTGKVRPLGANRKFSPTANLKAKTPSFGEALEEARGSKGQMNQPKTTPKKAAAQVAAGSKTPLAKAEPEAAKAVEPAVKADKAASTPVSDAGQSPVKSGKSAKADGKTALLEQAVEEPEAASATTLNAMLMAMAANAFATAPAAEVSAEAEGEAPREALALPVEPQPMALEALLPQDAAKTMQATQNQQLMDMLSGSVVNGTAEAIPRNVWMAEAGLASEVLSAEALLPQETALAGETAAKTSMVSAEMVSTEMPQGTDALKAQPMLVANAAPFSKAEPLASPAPAVKSTAANFWQGMGLTVEDTIALPVDAAMRSDVGDMAGETAQRDAKTPASLTDAFGTVTRQGAQLPEEAAFDAVSLSENAKTDPAAQPLASTFTPAVGLTNAAGTAGAAEVPQANGREVVRQIVEQAKLVRTDGSASEMVIRLKPEHLGELTMRISVAANGAVNASFHTDNPQTRGLIESSMVQLKQELSAQGIKVDNVSVYSGLSQDFFSNSQAGQQGYPQPQQSARSEKADRIAFAGDAEAVSAVGTERSGPASSLDPNVGTADGVDYRV